MFMVCIELLIYVVQKETSIIVYHCMYSMNLLKKTLFYKP